MNVSTRIANYEKTATRDDGVFPVNACVCVQKICSLTPVRTCRTNASSPSLFILWGPQDTLKINVAVHHLPFLHTYTSCDKHTRINNTRQSSKVQPRCCLGSRFQYLRCEPGSALKWKPSLWGLAQCEM